MKRTSQLVVLAMLSLAGTSRAHAQTSPASEYIDSQSGLSVDEAVRQAVAHEPSLRAARSEVDLVRSQREQAALRPNPGVMVEHRQQAGGSDSATTVQVAWPLDLFRRDARIELADRQMTAAGHAATDRVRVLSGEVRVRYGDAAAAIRRLDLATRARDILTRQSALVKARVDQGAAPAIEGDQIDVEQKRAELEELLATADADAAMIGLRRAIGLPPDAPLRLRESLDALTAGAAPTERPDAAAAIERRGDVLAAQATLRVSEAELAAARANARFDVSLTGGYMRMASSFPQFGVNETGTPEQVHDVFHYASVGATVSVPLGNKNQGQISAAVGEQAVAASRLEAARLAARTEIALTDGRAAQLERARDIATSAVSVAARNLNVLQQAYQLGRSTLGDVLTEQRRYLEVERTAIDTLKAMYDARVALRVARGEE